MLNSSYKIGLTLKFEQAFVFYWRISYAHQYHVLLILLYNSVRMGEWSKAHHIESLVIVVGRCASPGMTIFFS